MRNMKTKEVIVLLNYFLEFKTGVKIRDEIKKEKDYLEGKLYE